MALGQALHLDANSGAGYFLLGWCSKASTSQNTRSAPTRPPCTCPPTTPRPCSAASAVRNRRPAHTLPDAQAQAVERLLAAVRPTVSAVMIVKDAQTLARCLTSLQGWVDEIVVVDTGSTDGTVAVAESFGATIGHFAWVDDFSAARNHALSLATSEWVLVIDADETSSSTSLRCGSRACAGGKTWVGSSCPSATPRKAGNMSTTP